MNKILMVFCCSMTARLLAFQCSEPITVFSSSEDSIYLDISKIDVNQDGDAVLIYNTYQMQDGNEDSLVAYRSNITPATPILVLPCISISPSEVGSLFSKVMFPDWNILDFFPSTKSGLQFSEITEDDLSGIPLDTKFTNLNSTSSEIELAEGRKILSLGHHYIEQANRKTRSWGFINKLVSDNAQTIDKYSLGPVVAAAQLCSSFLYLFTDNAGNALAVWKRSQSFSGTTSANLVCSWYQNGKWSPWDVICPIPVNSKIGEMRAILGKKTGALAWILCQNDEESGVVQIISYSGTTWSHVAELTQDGENGEGVDISINQQGEMLATWVFATDDETSTKIGAAYSTNDRGWMRLDPNYVENTSYYQKVKSDREGNFVNVWVNWTEDAEDDEIEEEKEVDEARICGAVFRRKSKSWSDSTWITPPSIVANPVFALTEQGHGLIAWEELKFDEEIESSIQIAEFNY